MLLCQTLASRYDTLLLCLCDHDRRLGEWRQGREISYQVWESWRATMQNSVAKLRHKREREKL
jgi:hypothetical protein